MDIDYKKLTDTAKEASKNAYARYSGFMVGAALLCADGSVYTGCNVENISYGASICAERTAAVKAVSAGNKRFMALALYADTEDYIFPCGICRQFLIEFADEGMEIIVSDSRGNYKAYTLKELMPNAFQSF